MRDRRVHVRNGLFFVFFKNGLFFIFKELKYTMAQVFRQIRDGPFFYFPDFLVF